MTTRQRSPCLMTTFAMFLIALLPGAIILATQGRPVPRQ